MIGFKLQNGIKMEPGMHQKSIRICVVWLLLVKVVFGEVLESFRTSFGTIFGPFLGDCWSIFGVCFALLRQKGRINEDAAGTQDMLIVFL